MDKVFLSKLFLRCRQSRRFFLYLTLLLGVVLPGTALRLMSVHWNQRLQGDVNLYALTAREFQRVSRLEYPFKYDYYGSSRYESMRAQATQHPPLFPLLGGLVSKLTGNSDTFASLRVICFVTGLIVLGLVVVLARVTPSASIPVAFLLASFLPIMIDFSGNGSPYIILAAILAGVSILLLRFDPDRPRHYVLLGILLALGYMVHGAITLAVPGVMLFLALNAKRLRFNYLIVLCAAGFLTLAPMMVWNMSYQGVPIYSTQPVLARISLGTAKVGIRDGIITTYPASRSLRSLLGGYAHSQWGVVQKQFENLTTVVGPGMLLLAAIGLKRLLDEGLTSFVAMLGPSAIYLALSWLLPWPPQPRFILPVLPVLCVIASVGYKALTAVGRRGIILASLLLLLSAVWWIADFRFSPNQTRYYVEDTAYPADYDAMKQLALRMRTIRPGVVLGYSRRLDSGLEAVYYHDLPFVSGRRGLELFDRPEVEKLVQDFHVSYIWTDESLLEKLQEWFPRARVVLTGAPFSLLELRPNEDPVGDWPKGSTASTRVLSRWGHRAGLGTATIPPGMNGRVLNPRRPRSAVSTPLESHPSTIRGGPRFGTIETWNQLSATVGDSIAADQNSPTPE